MTAVPKAPTTSSFFSRVLIRSDSVVVGEVVGPNEGLTVGVFVEVMLGDLVGFLEGDVAGDDVVGSWVGA